MRQAALPTPFESAPDRDDDRLRDLAQHHAEDVVLAAALFKPNAAGHCELSWGGFGQRQLLKARGAYVAERVLVAVTPLDVIAVAFWFRGRVRRRVGQWRRSELSIVSVLAHGRALDASWPAFAIRHRFDRRSLEIQPLHMTLASQRVCDLLLTQARV